jgi:exodeoxyribonuclease V
MTQLAAQQLAGIDKIRAWYQAGLEAGWWPPFRLFGYAGTGKTTMAKEIPAALGLRNVVYGTFTGKAAHVLRTSPPSTRPSTCRPPPRRPAWP